jgi:hypothetical protein
MMRSKEIVSIVGDKTQSVDIILDKSDGDNQTLMRIGIAPNSGTDPVVVSIRLSAQERQQLSRLFA